MTPAPSRAHEYGKLLAKCARPQNVLYPGLLTATSAAILGAPLVRILAVYLLIAMLYAVAATYNNRSDREADALNKRTDNPLTGAQLPRRVVDIFIATNVIGLILIQFVLAQPMSLALTVTYIALSLLYSHPKTSVQSRGWLAPILLSLCYAVLPLLIGIAQAGDALPIHLAPLLILQFLLALPLLLAKDYKDEYGDRETGKRTVLVRYGVRITQGAGYGFTALASVLFIMLSMQLGYSLLISLSLAVPYALFCGLLHYKKGVMHNVYRKLAILLFIAMPLLILFKLY